MGLLTVFFLFLFGLICMNEWDDVIMQNKLKSSKKIVLKIYNINLI